MHLFFRCIVYRTYTGIQGNFKVRTNSILEIDKLSVLVSSSTRKNATEHAGQWDVIFVNIPNKLLSSKKTLCNDLTLHWNFFEKCISSNNLGQRWWLEKLLFDAKLDNRYLYKTYRSKSLSYAFLKLIKLYRIRIGRQIRRNAPLVDRRILFQ